MAICRSCGAESRRVRSIFEKEGKQLPEPKDICVHCAPESFDRFYTPSETKMWMSWEKDAAHYRKEYDKDGPIMMPSDSVLQDLQDAVCKQPEDELRAGDAAIQEKRANRRTEPMTSDETLAAINFARAVASHVDEYHRQADREREAMVIESWQAKETSSAIQ